MAGYPLISLILVNRFRVWFDLDFAHYLQELNIKQCRMGLAHGAWGVCGAQGQSGYLSPSRAGGCILTVEIFQATAPVSGDEVSVQPNWALPHTFLHGEVLFECKAPAFVSTGSVYLKNGMCPAPWKGWDVCRSQPLLYQRGKPHFRRFLQGILCLHGCLPWWLYVSGALGVHSCHTWAVPPSQSSW